MPAGIRLSVAIPVHNEESVLPELLERVRKVLDGLVGFLKPQILLDERGARVLAIADAISVNDGIHERKGASTRIRLKGRGAELSGHHTRGARS